MSVTGALAGGARSREPARVQSWPGATGRSAVCGGSARPRPSAPHRRHSQGCTRIGHHRGPVKPRREGLAVTGGVRSAERVPLHAVATLPPWQGQGLWARDDAEPCEPELHRPGEQQRGHGQHHRFTADPHGRRPRRRRGGSVHGPTGVREGSASVGPSRFRATDRDQAWGRRRVRVQRVAPGTPARTPTTDQQCGSVVVGAVGAGRQSRLQDDGSHRVGRSRSTRL
jgi:hypothetical protein